MNDNINKACDVLRSYGYYPSAQPQPQDQVLYRKGALEFRIEVQAQAQQKQAQAQQVQAQEPQARVTVPLDDMYDYRVNLPASSSIAEYIELHLKALHDSAKALHDSASASHEKALHDDDNEYGHLTATVKEDGDMSNIYSFVYDAYHQ